MPSNLVASVRRDITRDSGPTRGQGIKLDGKVHRRRRGSGEPFHGIPVTMWLIAASRPIAKTDSHLALTGVTQSSQQPRC